MYLTVLLLVVFAASVAFLVSAGLWSNTLTLINVVTAGLIAMNYFEPLAAWLEKREPTYTYVWDFLSIWLLFAVAMGLMRVMTDALSKVKVKFKRPVDQIGGIFLACWIGWLLVCFTTATLHTAPLARNFLDGAFQPQPNSRMFFSLAPDHRWLGFMQKMSRGPFSRSAPAGDPAAHVFDPRGEFILKYAQRRKNFESELGTRTATGS